MSSHKYLPTISDSHVMDMLARRAVQPQQMLAVHHWEAGKAWCLKLLKRTEICGIALPLIFRVLVWTGFYGCGEGFGLNNLTTSVWAACQYRSAVPALPLSLCLFPSVILSLHYYPSYPLIVTHIHSIIFPWHNLKDSTITSLVFAAGKGEW